MNVLKKRFKSALGTKWKYVVRLRNSDPVRRINACFALPVKLLNQRRNYPYLAVEIIGTTGMGALIIHVLRLLRHAQVNNLIPLIRISSSLYANSSNENLLETYFNVHEDATVCKPSLRFLKVRNEVDYRFLNVAMDMSLSDARSTFERFLSFNSEITGMVNRVLAENGGPFVLAIHYRGTDKTYEAPAVNYQEVFAACKSVIRQNPTCCVLLATDEAAFSRAIRAEFPNITFATFDFTSRSPVSGPRHFSSSLSPTEKSVEALVNIKLLSCTQYLIRTSSYLSAVSCILNDRMKVLTLGGLHKPQLFPERQIREMGFI